MNTGPRPTRDETWLTVAAEIAKRSTCLRRAVGCVLVNARGHVLATGYNGRAAGLQHCNESEYKGVDYVVDHAHSRKIGQRVTKPTKMVVVYPHACDGARASSGMNLDGCEAIHAEQNALLQCRDVAAIDTCYVTASPCVTCVKLLLNTGCCRIVFRDKYAHDEASYRLWCRPEHQWLYLPGASK